MVGRLSSALDAGDLHRRERLAMTLLTMVVLAAPELEDDDLLAPILRSDFRLDLCPGHERRPDLHRVACANEKDFAERDRVADVAGELLDPELVAGGDPVLLAARFDYRVHAHPLGSRARATRTRGGEN